jgi:hypothetical protein
VTENDMLGVVIVVLVFGLLAYDLAVNNGEWFGIVNGYTADILRELRYMLHV